MSDAHDEQPNRKSPGRPAPNPVVKPGERISLSALLGRIPQADRNLMRDVDALQGGGDRQS